MELENIQTVASLCCGVIGYSWALKFAMGGHEVYAYNRSEESSARAKQRVKESMDSLKKNGVYTDSEAEKIFVPHPLHDLAGGSRQECAVYSGILCRAL